MLRAVLNTVAIALLTIVGSVMALMLRLVDATGDRIVDLARVWSRIVTGLSGVDVRVVMRGKLEPGTPYVFMANHLSALDIWAVLVALPLRVRMIAKKQLRQIPLFGWAMAAGRFIFIDRQNAVAARRTIQEAQRRIRSGDSVLLFPEGTRSRDGALLPFKKGGFHLALGAGVPIVPVALKGTRELMPPGSLLLRPGVVQVIVGAPIPTAGLTDADRAALIDGVRAAIQQMLDDVDAAPVSTSHGRA